MNLFCESSHQVNQKILEFAQDYDHVIWDWNGTLIDDTEIAVQALNAMLTEHQLNPVDKIQYKNVFGFPIRNYYEKVGFDLNQLSFDKLCDRFVEEYNHKRSKSAKLFHGIHETLSEIKKTKTQSILSAAEQNHLNEMTEYYGVAKHFHYRFGIEDFKAATKLHRGLDLIQTVDIPKNKTLMIGDTDHDFEVAQALGIQCLLIADGHQNEDRLFIKTQNVISGRRS